MPITIELPADVEQRLRALSPNLDAEAKEALLVEMYRQDKLTRFELAQALGLERLETDGLLKRYHVGDAPPTGDEMEAGLRRLRQLAPP